MNLSNAVLVICLSGFLSAQAPQPSNQEGEVRQLSEAGKEGKAANLPGLDFYEAVVRHIQTGGQAGSTEVREWVNPGEPPAVRWYIQTHIAPAFDEDTLFTLRELTNDTAEVVVIVPRGGINLWYQLSTPCMTEKSMTVEEAARKLAYIRFQLSEKEFPAIRHMVNEFKKLKTNTYPLSDRYGLDGKRPMVEYLDWTSYSFKAKAFYWSYDIQLGPSDENPLISWAHSCSKAIWNFLKNDKAHGIPAHPLKSMDNNCIGQAILRAQARTGEIEEVRRLLELGVAVDSKDYWDEGTPLQAAVERYHLGIVKLLLAAGANPRAAKEDGRTVFHLLPDQFTEYYAKSGNEPPEWIKGLLLRAPHRIEIAEILRKAGVSIDQPDKEGVTPLMEAVRQGDPLLTSWLLEHGADRTRKDKGGESAMDRAAGMRAGMLKFLGEKQ